MKGMKHIRHYSEIKQGLGFTIQNIQDIKKNQNHKSLKGLITFKTFLRIQHYFILVKHKFFTYHTVFLSLSMHSIACNIFADMGRHHYNSFIVFCHHKRNAGLLALTSLSSSHLSYKQQSDSIDSFLLHFHIHEVCNK